MVLKVTYLCISHIHVTQNYIIYIIAKLKLRILCLHFGSSAPDPAISAIVNSNTLSLAT